MLDKMGLEKITSEVYKLSKREVLSILATDENYGLSEEEAEKRLKEFGPNRLKEEKKKSPIAIFIAQFRNAMSYLLMIAAFISFIIGENLDALAILVVLLVNALIGFLMEYRAERAIESLKKMVSVNALVLRNGTLKKTSAESLIPGDIVILEAGDVVPADIRILNADNLEANESILTGEALPVPKTSDPIESEVPIHDRSNILFAGTHVVRGRCKGVIYATGMSTEFGKISKALQSVEPPKTPMERRLEALSVFMLKLVVAIGLLVFLIGWLKGYSLLRMLETSIALAVAVVPEGLPIVVTITLAIGVHKMAKRNALMRNLAAVETLGSSNMICTDKTGTLTQNKMKVSSEFFPNDFSKREALKVGALCNNAYISGDDVIGDPMEVALLQWILDSGLNPNEIRSSFPRIKEIPFDSKIMKMTTIHEGFVAIKGAPEKLLLECRYIYDENGNLTVLSPDFKEKVLRSIEEAASQAMRTLGFAIGKSEEELVFLGFVGIKDPLRPEAKEAVQKCKNAGIDVVMLTGDHVLTASSIAKEVGIAEENLHPLEGKDIEKLSDEELFEAIIKKRVGARVLPEHKLRIVDVLQKKGYIVAMTGDGINDVIALKKADIGIAMGIAGTEVTKEASDMILQDDRFATIVDAIEAGRTIFDNIRKVIFYLLSCNISEVILILFSILWVKDLLLLPLQILWINLVTDVLPALGIAFDPPEEGVMKRPPRRINENLLLKNHYLDITIYGLSFAFLSLITGVIALSFSGLDTLKARSYVFHTLVFCQIAHPLTLRDKPVLSNPRTIFLNKVLLVGIFVSVLLQILTAYVPLLQEVLRVTPLSPREWLMITGVATLPLIFNNFYRIFVKESFRGLTRS